MALVQMHHINKTIITQSILKDLSLQIMPGEKVGLIGLNGVGKTTLFHLILGEDTAYEGEIIRRKGLTIGYMAQDFFLRDEEIPLYRFMEKAFQHLLFMEKEIEALEKRMGVELGEEGDEREYTKIMAKYTKLTQDFQEQGGYEYVSRIKGVLKGLGFQEEAFHTPLSTLSGGEKSRAELGRLLLTEPDLLLLDEPTNHLDIRTREWLEEYLSTYKKAVILISHDRFFLNRTVERIWELYHGQLEKYPGDFSLYRRERERRYLLWEKEFKRQQEHIARQKEYIRRNHAGNNARQAKSRKRQLLALEPITSPPPPPPLPNITFLHGESSGRRVLSIKGLSHSFQGERVLSHIDAEVIRGEKIALLGDNGSGKTTLFKIILGLINPERGVVEHGYKVHPAFYMQEHENLSQEGTILEELLSMGGIGYEEARRILGGLLFGEEDIPKEVGDLSGGERSRLALAKLAMTPSNLLLLDEPTNHLDILSRGRLEEAVHKYRGTCIIISHDRFFIDEVAQKIWELKEGTINEYHGNYSDYRRKKEEERKREEIRCERKESKRDKKREVKRIERGPSLHELEEKISALEEKREELEREFSQEDFYRQDGRVIAERKETYQGIEKELEVLYEKWEEVLTNL